MNIDRDDLDILLSMVCPRCFNCADPATRYEGRPSNGDPAVSYACDDHSKVGVKYSDLPASGLLRRIRAAIANEP